MAAAEAAVAGMPAVMVNHGGVGEGTVPKDIRLENFSISLGGKELINQATVTLAYGRRYGESFLRLNCGLFWSSFFDLRDSFAGAQSLRTHELS